MCGKCAGCRARRAWLSLPAAITVLRRLLAGGVPRMLAVGPATRAPQHALATGLDAASPTVEVMDGPELPQLAEAIPDPEQEAAIPGLTGKWLVRTVPGDVERASAAPWPTRNPSRGPGVAGDQGSWRLSR